LKLKICVGIDRKNHKIPETLMITQRIGMLKFEELIINDDQPRILYDKIVEE